MLLTILATSLLERSMASMAVVISNMLRTPSCALPRVSEASCLACSAFLAVEWIMLETSSNDALVSSMAAACSLAPWASLWLASVNWLDAMRLCSVPSWMSRATRIRGLIDTL